MQYIKKSTRQNPKISLVLLDWSVRESLHLLHYLSLQTLPRDQFEVIIIEYYSTISPAVKKFEHMIDSWILLDMPEDTYYHKHLMYNAGIACAKGDIVFIGDSDAMVKPSFLSSIVNEFEQNENIVLHLDQFRNNRRDLYPFCYPSFEEVIGEGCINNVDGKTAGVVTQRDPLHNRNYGSGFCATRKDLIAIGGADEHIDYIGHICGPYDMTFRLINMGRKEIWHQEEFLYHTWHPGQAGQDNYLGPHDGRHMSTTSLDLLMTRQIQPHVINPVISSLQQDEPYNDEMLQRVVDPTIVEIAKRAFLEGNKSREFASNTYKLKLWKGYLIVKDSSDYCSCSQSEYTHIFSVGDSFESLAQKIKMTDEAFTSSRLDDIKVKIANNSKGTYQLALNVTYFILYFIQFCRVYVHPFIRKTLKLFSRIVSKVVCIFSNLYARKDGISKQVNFSVQSLKNMVNNLQNVKKHGQMDVYFLMSSCNINMLFFIFLKIARISKTSLNVVDPACDDFVSLMKMQSGKFFFISRDLYVGHSDYLLSARPSINFIVI